MISLWASDHLTPITSTNIQAVLISSRAHWLGFTFVNILAMTSVKYGLVTRRTDALKRARYIMTPIIAQGIPVRILLVIQSYAVAVIGSECLTFVHVHTSVSIRRQSVSSVTWTSIWSLKVVTPMGTIVLVWMATLVHIHTPFLPVGHLNEMISFSALALVRAHRVDAFRCWPVSAHSPISLFALVDVSARSIPVFKVTLWTLTLEATRLIDTLLVVCAIMQSLRALINVQAIISMETTDISLFALNCTAVTANRVGAFLVGSAWKMHKTLIQILTSFLSLIVDEPSATNDLFTFAIHNSLVGHTIHHSVLLQYFSWCLVVNASPLHTVKYLILFTVWLWQHLMPNRSIGV